MQQNIKKSNNYIAAFESIRHEIEKFSFTEELSEKKTSNIFTRFIKYLIKKGKINEVYIFAEIYIMRLNKQINEIKILKEIEKIQQKRPEKGEYLRKFTNYIYHQSKKQGI